MRTEERFLLPKRLIKADVDKVRNLAKKIFDEISLYYDCLYNDASNVDKKVGLELHELFSIFLKDKKDNKRIIDLGCGTSVGLITLASFDYKIDAIDYSKKMIETSLGKCKGVNKNIEFKVEDYLQYLNNIDDDSIDIIMARGNAFDYIFDDEYLLKLLNVISKKLKPKGLFYYSARNWDDTFNKLGYYFVVTRKLNPKMPYIVIYNIKQMQNYYINNIKFIKIEKDMFIKEKTYELPFYPVKMQSFIDKMLKNQNIKMIDIDSFSILEGVGDIKFDKCLFIKEHK